MGPVKDSFLTAVWAHLQQQPSSRSAVSALSNSTSSALVRAAWATLQENCESEGIGKAVTMVQLLQERSDIFELIPPAEEGGEQTIGLTEGAQVRDPNEGLPPSILPADTVGSSDCAAIVSLSEGGAAAVASPVTGTTLDERPAKLPRLDKGKGKGKEMGKSRHGAAYVWNMGYKDLVWTPEMQMKKDSEKSKESALAWALYKAVEMHGGQNVTLSQLGSDFKVAELKKDPHFKNWRLLDILKEYEAVFEITIAPQAAGGMYVKLQPGAEAALPDADKRVEQVSEEDFLPERIENPRIMLDKVQALRIELLHALHRRGGKCAIQELGQEPRLQEKKKLVHQAKKLVDWVKVFPENFLVESDGQQMVVEILSKDVSDTRMIDRAIGRASRDDDYRDRGDRGGSSNNFKNSGRDGGGGGRDHGGRDSGRGDGGRSGGGRDRDRNSKAPRRSSPSRNSSGGYGHGGYPPQQPPPHGYPPGGAYPGYPAAGQHYPPQPGYPGVASHYHGHAAGYPQQPSAYPPSSYTPALGYGPPAGYQQAPAYPPPAGAYQPSQAHQPPAHGHPPVPTSSSQPPPHGYSQPPPAGHPPPPVPGGYSAHGHPPPQSAAYPASGYGPPPSTASYPPPSHPPSCSAGGGGHWAGHRY